MHNKVIRQCGQLAGRALGRALSSLDGMTTLLHSSRMVPGSAHPHALSLALAGLAQRPLTEHADNLPAHAGILQWCHCTLIITSGQHHHSAVIKQEEPVQGSLLKLQVIPVFFG